MTGAEQVGQNIRRLRKARILKQITVAELCGYTATGSGTISKIERGRMVIDVNVADRVAQALNVELAQLLPGVRVEENPLPTPFQSSEIQAIISLAQELTRDEQVNFLRCARLLRARESGIATHLDNEIAFLEDAVEVRRRKRGAGVAPEANHPPAS